MYDQGMDLPPTSLVGSNTTLFRLTGANMNSTADQQFTKAFAFTNFVVDKIIATNASGAIALATGGVYTAPAKAGTAIVAAAQSWAGLTTTTKVANPAVTAAGQDLQAATALYLSLTTAMGSAGTCDISIMGIAS